MITLAIPHRTRAGRYEYADHQPVCVAHGCNQRTPGLLIPTCGAKACEQVDSRYERMHDRWDNQ